MGPNTLRHSAGTRYTVATGRSTLALVAAGGNTVVDAATEATGVPFLALCWSEHGFSSHLDGGFIDVVFKP
jgi:hypothetical protein